MFQFNFIEVVPKATVSPDRITIPQGTTGTLRCAVTGVPPPKVTWSKARGELTSRHQVISYLSDMAGGGGGVFFFNL